MNLNILLYATFNLCMLSIQGDIIVHWPSRKTVILSIAVCFSTPLCALSERTQVVKVDKHASKCQYVLRCTAWGRMYVKSM